MPIHSIANACIRMISIPLEWIPMDWSPVEPPRPGAESRERPGSSWRMIRDRIVAGVGFPVPARAAKRGVNWPLAHARSPRDNCNYRASLTLRNRLPGSPEKESYSSAVCLAVRPVRSRSVLMTVRASGLLLVNSHSHRACTVAFLIRIRVVSNGNGRHHLCRRRWS